MHTYILLSLLVSIVISCSALKKIQCSTATLKCGTLCLFPNIPCIVCVTAISANCCNCVFPDWYGCNTTEITNLIKELVPQFKNKTSIIINETSNKYNVSEMYYTFKKLF